MSQMATSLLDACGLILVTIGAGLVAAAAFLALWRIGHTQPTWWGLGALTVGIAVIVATARADHHAHLGDR